MKVWVVTGKSESGDEYGPIVYLREPTSKELDDWALLCDSGDTLGMGRAGSYVYVQVNEIIAIK
jgi:hypothetical protein